MNVYFTNYSLHFSISCVVFIVYLSYSFCVLADYVPPPPPLFSLWIEPELYMITCVAFYWSCNYYLDREMEGEQGKERVMAINEA